MALAAEVPASDASVTVTGNSGTITLPAVANRRHYIAALHITRTCVTAPVVGNAALSVTTTNLPGGPQWQFGNAMAVGAIQTDLMSNFACPLRASTAGTATTIVLPAAGTNVSWNATCYYSLGD